MLLPVPVPLKNTSPYVLPAVSPFNHSIVVNLTPWLNHQIDHRTNLLDMLLVCSSVSVAAFRVCTIKRGWTENHIIRRATVAPDSASP